MGTATLLVMLLMAGRTRMMGLGSILLQCGSIRICVSLAMAACACALLNAQGLAGMLDHACASGTRNCYMKIAPCVQSPWTVSALVLAAAVRDCHAGSACMHAMGHTAQHDHSLCSLPPILLGTFWLYKGLWVLTRTSAAFSDCCESRAALIAAGQPCNHNCAQKMRAKPRYRHEAL